MFIQVTFSIVETPNADGEDDWKTFEIWENGTLYVIKAIDPSRVKKPYEITVMAMDGAPSDRPQFAGYHNNSTLHASIV